MRRPQEIEQSDKYDLMCRGEIVKLQEHEALDSPVQIVQAPEELQKREPTTEEV